MEHISAKRIFGSLIIVGICISVAWFSDRLSIIGSTLSALIATVGSALVVLCSNAISLELSKKTVRVSKVKICGANQEKDSAEQKEVKTDLILDVEIEPNWWLKLRRLALGPETFDLRLYAQFGEKDCYYPIKKKEARADVVDHAGQLEASRMQVSLFTEKIGPTKYILINENFLVEPMDKLRDLPSKDQKVEGFFYTINATDCGFEEVLVDTNELAEINDALRRANKK